MSKQTIRLANRRRTQTSFLPRCPLCGLPMTFKARGYSQDHQGYVDLYYCENDSTEYPDGCPTQKRVAN